MKIQHNNYYDTQIKGLSIAGSSGGGGIRHIPKTTPPPPPPHHKFNIFSSLFLDYPSSLPGMLQL
jgi:hypothetical protein